MTDNSYCDNPEEKEEDGVCGGYWTCLCEGDRCNETPHLSVTLPLLLAGESVSLSLTLLQCKNNIIHSYLFVKPVIPMQCMNQKSCIAASDTMPSLYHWS